MQYGSAVGQCRQDHAAYDSHRPPTDLFSLPLELRLKIYAMIRSASYLDIVSSPQRILQPAISMISRSARAEVLDFHYGSACWLQDMRGWRCATGFPHHWTAYDIFIAWIRSVGDENAARIKKFIFYYHSFRIILTRVRREGDTRTIVFTLKSNRSNYRRVSPDAPENYTFTEALRRAELYLQRKLNQMTREDRGRQPFTAKGIEMLYLAIEQMKPSLCVRHGVGHRGAWFDRGGRRRGRPPRVASGHGILTPFDAHTSACADCGQYTPRL